MGDYTFHVDRKMISWERSFVNIEADTYKEALEKATEKFDAGNIIYDAHDSEQLDSWEMSLEESKGDVTEELWVDTENDDEEHQNFMIKDNSDKKPMWQNGIQQSGSTTGGLGPETPPIHRISGIRRYI